MKLLISVLVLLTLSSAEKLPYMEGLKEATIKLSESKEYLQFIQEFSKVIFSEEILAPLERNLKYELFSYTIDEAKSSPIASKKFECADLAKPNSPIKKDKPFVLIYVSDKKSKDGKELIGKTFNETEIKDSNLIYNAYTEGASELAPVGDSITSFVHLIKCLVHNDIHVLNLRLHKNEYVLNLVRDFVSDLTKFVKEFIQFLLIKGALE